jgi:hypothetical protein
MAGYTRYGTSAYLLILPVCKMFLFTALCDQIEFLE